MSDDASVRALPPAGVDSIRARHLARREAAAGNAAVAVEVVDDATGEAVRGSLLPRVFTPPLIVGAPGPCGCGCALTTDTSYGFDLYDFSVEIGWPLDPWQRWLAIHQGELLPDGRPRFRFVLVLVARQNGKTIFGRVLTLYWMLVEQVPMIVGTNTSRDTAKSSWRAVIDFVTSDPALRSRFGKPRETIGEEAFPVRACASRCEIEHQHQLPSVYRFAAPNRRAGRSFTVHRGLLDELREHQDWDTHDALINAMNAVDDAQAVAITNQGDLLSIVLDSFRTSAIEYIETGAGDPRLFLAEWSAPSGSDPTDPRAIAAANPGLGDRVKLDNVIGQAIRAKANGGDQLARFKTEVLCMRVPLLDPAIDPDQYRACGVGRADFPDLAAHRRSVAAVLDVAKDATHATLSVAAVVDDVVYGEIVQAWQGPDCTKRVRAELPGLLEKIRPRSFGWFPDGPAAVITADLRKRRGVRVVPRGTRAEEIRGEVAPVCMGFADLIKTQGYRHARDPLATAHVERTQKLHRGDVWTFTRAGTEPVDATYAMAGAAHLARIVPRPRALSVAPGPAADGETATGDPGF